jgi:transposase-like protein
MQDRTNEPLSFPSESSSDVLTEILREGAHRLLIQSIQSEVQEYLEARSHLCDENGHHQVVRNGYLPKRPIQTPVGSMEIQQPRIRDRRGPDEAEQFSSKILPPYLRKTKAIEDLIPWLYLKGISTGDFTDALQALLGPNAAGLSATTITRLKSTWEKDFQEWSQRRLIDKRYVYVWADGIYFNIRLEAPGNDRQCILVLMGATAQGKKELIAIADGYRESEQSWKELLLSLKDQGLDAAPQLAIGDGALGFWKAISEVWPTTRWQRCWVHKTRNVLNKMPKSIQGKAKNMLHPIWMAAEKVESEKAFDLFVDTFEAKYPKATECLNRDREHLLAFYDFPAEHWIHVRTTNPIESTFATVRLRTKKTKGCGSRNACLTMVFKLAQCAQKRWRALNGHQLINDLIQGVQFVDGVKKAA